MKTYTFEEAVTELDIKPKFLRAFIRNGALVARNDGLIEEAELRDFERRRNEAAEFVRETMQFHRHDPAYLFAHQDETRAAAIEELADELDL